MNRLLTYLFLLSLLGYTPDVAGQTADCGTSCSCILEKANREADLDVYRPDLDFQKALRLYEAARLCYLSSEKRDSVAITEGRIVYMFERLKQLKEEAEQAERTLDEKNKALAAQAEELRKTEAKLLKSLEELVTEQNKLLATQDELYKQKEEARKQFLVAENRRLDYIIKQLLDEKKHSDALGIWNYKRVFLTEYPSLYLTEIRALYKGSESISSTDTSDYISLSKDLIDIITFVNPPDSIARQRSPTIKDIVKLKHSEDEKEALNEMIIDSAGMTLAQFQQNFSQSAPLALIRRSCDTIAQILDNSLLGYHITPSGIVILAYPDQLQGLNHDGDVVFIIEDKIKGVAINADGRRLAYYNDEGYKFCSITVTRDQFGIVYDAEVKIIEEVKQPNIQGLSFSCYSSTTPNLEYLVVVTNSEFFIHNQYDNYRYDYSKQGWSDLKVLSYPGTSFKSWRREGEAFVVQFRPANDRTAIDTRLVVIAPKNGKRRIKLTQYQHYPGGLTIEPGRNFVIGHGRDNTIKYLNDNGRQLAFFQALEGQMTVSPFDDRGNTLLSIHTDSSLWVYNIKGQPWLKLENAFDQLSQVYHMKDNASVITCDKGKLQLWSLKDGLVSQTEDLDNLGYGKIIATTMDLSRKLLYLLTEKGYWMQYAINNTDSQYFPQVKESLLTDKEIQAYDLSQ